MVAVLVAMLPPSLAVEVTVRAKLPSCAEVAVSVSADRFQPEILIGVEPSLVTVCARVPSVNTTPAGAPAIVVASVSSASAGAGGGGFTRAALMLCAHGTSH